MMPGRAAITEAEYWRDFDIIRNDVNAAMVCCYTHRALNHLAATDEALALRLNRTPGFWQVTSFSLQNSLFIVLARILDSDDHVHSVHQLLRSTTAHPEFFNKASLPARKLRLSNDWDWGVLDEYIARAWEPSVQDLRALKKALAPHKGKFDAIYRPIRHQIAHIIYKDDASIAALYSRTLKADIDEILCFLFTLVQAIQEVAHNARRPELAGDHYGYAHRVEEITKETEALLRSL